MAVYVHQRKITIVVFKWDSWATYTDRGETQNVKKSSVLIQDIIAAYFPSDFADSLLARFDVNLSHSIPMPPFVTHTRIHFPHQWHIGSILFSSLVHVSWIFGCVRFFLAFGINMRETYVNKCWLSRRQKPRALLFNFGINCFDNKLSISVR